jgi:transcriptional regulator with XRE-family HTH domain
MGEIGDFIRERREAKKLSMRALGRMADVSNSEIYRIEIGERPNPSITVLKALSKALGVPTEEMLRKAGYKADEDTPLMEKLFPDLKTEEQQQAAQRIIDGLARNTDLQGSDYDALVNHMEMFFDYAKKKRASEKG